MKYTNNTKQSELLCKCMQIKKNNSQIIIICKLTELKCIASYDAGTFGYHTFKEDVIRCPSHKKNFKKQKIKKFKRIK